jgi:hypothetical protein
VSIEAEQSRAAMPTAKPAPAPTPKAVIHQRYGAKAVYRAEEVREAVDGGCPGLALPQSTRCVYRGHLDLDGVLSVSTPGTFVRKKDAEQAAAQMAIDKVLLRFGPVAACDSPLVAVT